MANYVAPLAGAWIEIAIFAGSTFGSQPVAPLAGAWIEIVYQSAQGFGAGLSLPSRERGLKYKQLQLLAKKSSVSVK